MGAYTWRAIVAGEFANATADPEAYWEQKARHLWEQQARDLLSQLGKKLSPASDDDILAALEDSDRVAELIGGTHATRYELGHVSITRRELDHVSAHALAMLREARLGPLDGGSAAIVVDEADRYIPIHYLLPYKRRDAGG